MAGSGLDIVLGLGVWSRRLPWYRRRGSRRWRLAPRVRVSGPLQLATVSAAAGIGWSRQLSGLVEEGEGAARARGQGE